MCYLVCRELNLNAIYISLQPQHLFEIEPQKCYFPKCTACLPYCPAPGSIVEAESGRSMVPPPRDVHRWHLEPSGGDKT
jgi:hypothetical protein